MLALTSEEAKVWCTERGLRIDESGCPHFPDRSKNNVWFVLPNGAHRLPYMVLALMDAEVNDLDEVTGTEHLLWITERGIWQNWIESTGLEHFEALRKGFGVFDGLDEKPATVFSDSELRSLIGCAVVPLIYGWDCYIIPSAAQHFAFLSHDEYAGVSTIDDATAARFMDDLKGWGAKAHGPQ
jgi:hypothetical protein